MKQAGGIILIIGLLITLFAGFKFVTKKKVVEIGNLEITKDKNHVMDWSPLAGVAVILIGGSVYILGTRRDY